MATIKLNVAHDMSAELAANIYAFGLATADTVVTATIAGTPTAGTMDVEVEFTVGNDG